MVITMLDRTEETYIDVAADSRKAKSRMSAKEWRDKYFRLAKIGSDTLSPVQWKFANTTSKFAYFRSGNQSGKSFSIAYLIALTATGRYPADYTGWKPKLRDGAYSAIIWVLSASNQMVRDGLQQLLLGDVASGNIGTGLIPRDSIVAVNRSHGLAGLVDFAVIKRDDGTLVKIAFKSYEQGREALQAEPVSLVVCDELLDDIDMWNELVARTTATSGIIRLTATEKLQASPVARFFNEGRKDAILIQGSVDDAVHLSPEQKEAAKSQYSSEAERNIRYYGLASQGGGSVFHVPVSEIIEPMNPATFPPWWKYMIAVDFSHFGQGEASSQFACVFMALDPSTGIIRIFDAFKMRGIVEQHVARIRTAGGMGIRIAWPHDGTQGQADGGNIASLYKKAGLNMLPTHATFENGGYNFESGVELINNLLSNRKLKVASHLAQWFEEYRMYERDDKGQVIKRADDLMSATRIGCMSIRNARILEEHRETIANLTPQPKRDKSLDWIWGDDDGRR